MYQYCLRRNIKKAEALQNEQILKNLISFISILKNNPKVEAISLEAKSVESLVIKNKFRSIKLNFIYAYREILNFLESNYTDIDDESIVLDVCCGLGFFTKQLGEIYPRVKGIDLNESFLEFAVENSINNNNHKIEYSIHDINNSLPSYKYYLICSIFGINAAVNPINVVTDFIKNNPRYIILFDGNSNSVYRYFNKIFSLKLSIGVDFNSIITLLEYNNFKIIVEKNVHTLPSSLIDQKGIGSFFEELSIFLRKFNIFSASKLIIARNMSM